jgi:hypothetical protein
MKRILIMCMVVLSTYANEKIVLDQDEYCKDLKTVIEHFKLLSLSTECFLQTSKSLKQKTLCTAYKTGTVLTSKLFYHACRH